MKVGFFFQQADRGWVEGLLRRAGKRGIAAAAFRFAPHWQTGSFEDLGGRLRDVTHLVIVGTPRELEDSWSLFVAGAAVRRDLTVLAADGLTAADGLFASVPFFHEEETLFSYLYEQQRRHDRIGSIEQARNDLISEGLAITGQAMADAVADGREEDLLRFMRIGFDANTTDGRGQPLLVIAVKNRRKALVDLLLDRGADVNAVTQDRLTSPLMEAAVLGEDVIVSKLIEAGADLNLQAHNGQTALMMAISEGHLSVVERLLEENCETDQIDNLGMSARKYADLFKKESIRQLLEDHGF